MQRTPADDERTYDTVSTEKEEADHVRSAFQVLYPRTSACITVSECLREREPAALPRCETGFRVVDSVLNFDRACRIPSLERLGTYL